MSIQIPNYIENIASVTEEHTNTVSIRLECTCGCNRFFVTSTDDKAMYKEIENDFNKRFGSKVEIRSDKLGEVQYVRRNFFGKITDSANVKEYAYPSNRVVFFGKCQQCNHNYVIYDNWKFGFDAMEKEPPIIYRELKSSTQKDHTKGVGSEVYITYRNNIDEEDLLEMKEDYPNENLSILFSEIVIYISDDGYSKKKKIYQEETR